MSATGRAVLDLRRDEGATLLEMLVVMALMVMTAGLVFPNLRRPYRAILAEATRSSIVSDLRATRAEAVRDGADAAFEVSQDGRAYSFAGRSVRLPGSVRLQAQPRSILFGPDGGSDGARLMVVQDRGRSLPIAVFPGLGVVDMEAGR
jgi:type II secretory pathway pseudopilin PulG